MTAELLCPCGTGNSEMACCLPIREDGAGLGTTAEQLMRARYTGYVRRDRRFLLESWHPTTQPKTLEFDGAIEWLGLDVLGTTRGTAFDADGIVEFRASFRRGTEHSELHERSTFSRLHGRWVYVFGELNPAPL